MSSQADHFLRTPPTLKMSWWATGTSPSALSQSLHTVFCAECTSNFDWKSAGVYYTHRVSGMPGKIKRLLACTDRKRPSTQRAASRWVQPLCTQTISIIRTMANRRAATISPLPSCIGFVRRRSMRRLCCSSTPTCCFARQSIRSRSACGKGLVVSEHVRYLDNGISRHLPENFLQLVGGDPSSARFAKAAGWYHIFHLDDLKAIAPRWLYYCEQIRTHPQLYWDMNGSKSTWHPLAQQATRGLNYLKTGDDYVKFGEAPWISEMYGYVVAAAEQLIDTKLLDGLVEYTDWTSAAMPPGGQPSYTMDCTAMSTLITLRSITIPTLMSAPAPCSSSARPTRQSRARHYVRRPSTLSTTRCVNSIGRDALGLKS